MGAGWPWFRIASCMRSGCEEGADIRKFRVNLVFDLIHVIEAAFLMVRVESHLDKCRVHTCVGGIKRRNVVHHADIGQHHFQVLLRNNLAYQILDLRQFYACIRPVKYFPGVPSPVRHPERVNMTVFRENTEDLYAGIEWASGSEEADRLARFLQEEFKVSLPENAAIG